MPRPTRSILVTRQSSYSSVCFSPIKKSNAICHASSVAYDDDKENALSSLQFFNPKQRPEKTKPTYSKQGKKSSRAADVGCQVPGRRALKPSSLQLCMKMNERDFSIPSLLMDPLVPADSVDAWDYSDSEAAPASSWSTLPNRSLLFRPLPLDIGRCTCIIVKERLPGLDGARVYSLYTNEGQGRQDRKLAVARHRRRGGRSEFVIAQNWKAISCNSDEGFLGTMTANLMGSKYYIWDQGKLSDAQKMQSKRLLAAVSFVSTVTTLTGRFRSMRVWIPKTQSMLLKSTNTLIHHVGGLPRDWEEKLNKTDQLSSKVPYYNDTLKRYELDFRERARGGLTVLPSVKNFQLTMEEHGKQCILLLGRAGKSKYLMDYRFPLTAYQAFAICLSSIDSKLCCSV